MKNQFILWVLLFALTSTLQAQGLDLEPEPRPFRASAYIPWVDNARGYALEWRPYHQISLAYLEKKPFYVNTLCPPQETCPGQYHIVNDKGVQNLEVRFWFMDYFYVAFGQMKSKGFSQEVFKEGDRFYVGEHLVEGGSFRFRSTVPAAVTPSFGIGGEYLFPRYGLLLWVGLTASTKLHQGDPTLSSTNPDVTQEDIDSEVLAHGNNALRSRQIWAVATLGYAF